MRWCGENPVVNRTSISSGNNYYVKIVLGMYSEEPGIVNCFWTIADSYFSDTCVLSTGYCTGLCATLGRRRPPPCAQGCTIAIWNWTTINPSA